MQKRILMFAPAAYNLAETTRMLEIAKAIGKHEQASQLFEVRFMSEGGKFERLIEECGFPLERIEPRITEEKIAHILAINDEEKFGAIYSKKEVIAKVEGDVAFLKKMRPVAVITGSYVSVPVACQIEDIPLVWTIQSTWLPEFFASGAGVTDDMRSGLLKTIVNFFVFSAIRFWMWYGFIRPINQAARHFGVRPYKPVFDYFRGAITLVAEPAEFTGIKLPENYFFTGPLIADLSAPIPESVRNIPRDKPLVYFAMGSSGVPRIVAQIIESFRNKPYRVIAPVKALIDKYPEINIPDNVVVTDWLPALEVSKMADISVIHGGVGTVMTAAYAGKPVVGIGMQPEQVANLACLVRKGFAIRIPKSNDAPARVQSAIAHLLNDDAAKQKAAAFAKIMEQWDGPRLAAEVLLRAFGGPASLALSDPDGKKKAPAAGATGASQT